MPSTRTPLQPATDVCEAHALVGWHNYIVRYRPGQEDLARESIYRMARNHELAFSLADAATMAEQIPLTELACEPGCDCDACFAERNRERVERLEKRNKRLAYDLETAKSIIGLSFAAIALLIWRPWA